MDDSNQPLQSMKLTEKPTFLELFFIVISLLLIFYLAERQTQKPSPPLETKKQVLAIESLKERPGIPMRLKIPQISVDAAIEYVGLTSQGAMEVPNSIVAVGWFGLGVRPGEKGSAVIAGHFNGKKGEEGVFAKLSQLKAGDKLYTIDNKGASLAFVIREIRTFDPGYEDNVFSRNDSAHLNLITCDGTWNAFKKSYSKRLVVFADIIQ